MKIISQQEKYNIDKKSNKIKDVTMVDSIYAEIPFNLANVAYREIEDCGEYITISYKDKALADAVGGLVYDIANNNDWVYPDYHNVKLSMLLSLDGEKFSANLCIEVQPPKYSETDKAEILATADKNMFNTDFSEYALWQDIFASAEDFHNGNDMSENSGFYSIEFTAAEQNNLLWFLLQHMSMIANGGHYVD